MQFITLHRQSTWFLHLAASKMLSSSCLLFILCSTHHVCHVAPYMVIWQCEVCTHIIYITGEQTLVWAHLCLHMPSHRNCNRNTSTDLSKLVWITYIHMAFPTGYCLRDKIIKYSQKSPDTLHLVCSWLPCSLLLEVLIIPCPYFSSQLCVTSCCACRWYTEWASLI